MEEMTAIEAALAAGRAEEMPRYLTDRWLADVTLFGPPTKIRDGIEAWREAGIRTPVIVPLLMTEPLTVPPCTTAALMLMPVSV